ncbi:MAG: DUF2157 domain-containing protein [Micrococcales bacterium]|nr:DUF2157 domain-containing protein [Micrococcales bacterium]
MRSPDSQSLARSVDALVGAGLVEPQRREEALDVLAASVGSSRDRQTTSVLTEIAGYVGGILVLAAAAVFLATQWHTMSPATRVASLVAAALVLIGAGAAATRLGIRGTITDPGQEIRRYLASVLLVGGAIVLGFAAGLWSSEFTALRDPRPQSVGFATVVLAAALSYLVAPSAVALAGMALPLGMFCASVVFDQYPSEHDPLWFGGMLLVAGLVWGWLTELGAFREATAGRIITGAFAVIGAQNLAFGTGLEWIGYAALAAVGALGFAFYVHAGAWPYLATGVLALTMAATEAAVDWSNGALGAAGALLIAGAVLLGLSLLGMRMRREAAASV